MPLQVTKSKGKKEEIINKQKFHEKFASSGKLWYELFSQVFFRGGGGERVVIRKWRPIVSDEAFLHLCVYVCL